MSITYYNQKWETAISKLLDNVEEENFPLEENKTDKGVLLPSFRSHIKKLIMNGSNTMEHFIWGTLKSTGN